MLGTARDRDRPGAIPRPRARGPRTRSQSMDGRRLSNTVGTVLDPVFALRYRVRVPAGATARIAFWTAVAPHTPAGARPPRQAPRRQRLRARQHAGLDAGAGAAAAPRHHRGRGQPVPAPGGARALRRRVAPAVLRPRSGAAAAGPRRSGARAFPATCPSCCCGSTTSTTSRSRASCCRRTSTGGMKQLAVDLVILNERAASYIQDLQIALETLHRTSQSRGPIAADDARGSVFILRTDLIPAATRDALSSVARVVLAGQRGSLADQLDRARGAGGPGHDERIRAGPRPRRARRPVPRRRTSSSSTGSADLRRTAREYVTLLAPGQSTPAPWINVVANPAFGFQVAAEGSGFTWSLNSRENQLTPWSNDPVTDRPGEAIYLRDEDTGEVWGPTAAPIHDRAAFHSRPPWPGIQPVRARIARHRARPADVCPARGPDQDFAPHDSQHVRRGRAGSRSPRTWNGCSARRAPTRRPSSSPRWTRRTGAMFAHNPWNAGFGDASRVRGPGRPADAVDRGPAANSSVGTARWRDPAALRGTSTLSQRVGRRARSVRRPAGTRAARRPARPSKSSSCSAQAADAAGAQALIERYRSADLEAVLRQRRRALGRRARHGPGEDAGPLDGHHPQSLDALPDARLPHVGASRRSTRPAAPTDSATSCRTRWRSRFRCPRSRASTCCAPPAGNSREGDVQHWWLPADGPGRSHAHLRRPHLARARDAALRRQRPAMSRCSTKSCRSSKARPCGPASTTRSSSRPLPTNRRRSSSTARARSTRAWPSARTACR